MGLLDKARKKLKKGVKKVADVHRSGYQTVADRVVRPVYKPLATITALPVVAKAPGLIGIKDKNAISRAKKIGQTITLQKPRSNAAAALKKGVQNIQDVVKNGIDIARDTLKDAFGGSGTSLSIPIAIAVISIGIGLVLFLKNRGKK